MRSMPIESARHIHTQETPETLTPEDVRNTAPPHTTNEETHHPTSHAIPVQHRRYAIQQRRQYSVEKQRRHAGEKRRHYAVRKLRRHAGEKCRYYAIRKLQRHVGERHRPYAVKRHRPDSVERHRLYAVERHRLYAVERHRLCAVKRHRCGGEASTLCGGEASTLCGKEASMWWRGIDSMRWRGIDSMRWRGIDRLRWIGMNYRYMRGMYYWGCRFDSFRCCSLYRTIYKPRRRRFHARRAICRSWRAVRCASLFAPLIYAFALHSARFARTSRCVGVPDASDASNAGYGRRVAPTQR
jgi:hypothetical protein